MIKIQDEEGNDLFIIDDDAKKPRQVAPVKKYNEDNDPLHEMDENEQEKEDESDA